MLASLPVYDGPKVIYGERCLLSFSRLKRLNITFRQTPYDIKGR
jgi:adenine-specific DNA-methyltransferase